MRIKNVSIKNFRSIKEAEFSLKDLSIFIGNNGTGKTSILEAIHFALSPYYLSGRIKPTDFYNGMNNPITIEIEFDSSFDVKIPDGFTTQKVPCNKVHLEIKKRQKAAANKSFADGFVIGHHIIPCEPKGQSGWEIMRKSGKPFRFTERSLTLGSVETDNFIRSFYFNKNRTMQLKKGYNSSISAVFDDFNWRFSNNIQKKSGETSLNSFQSCKQKLEELILENVDNKAYSKVFQTLNEKSNSFGLDESKLSFISGQAPFDNAFISKTAGDLNVSVDNLGSGVEMIISLLLLETLASLSKENIAIIIDEPELHLHPALQDRLIDYLKDISQEKQIILSTHSPYFFKNCISNDNVKLLITKTENEKCIISESDIALKSFPWSPSWGEINYFAYKVATIEFYNELYGYLQSKLPTGKLSEVDNYLLQNGIKKDRTWKRKIKDDTIVPECVTVMTYIRNFIHHPENKNNEKYTDEELKESIQHLVNILSKLTL